MSIRETVTHFISHFAPQSLVKEIFPVLKSNHVLTHAAHESKPWMNVDSVEITAEDFA